ncbi:hypothetical protein QIS74_02779 [Colletotrichum tabaci]|uniref:Uncharacterized protein n=1 Tax=Colletotrichum tabaci TaxID=1209068 RepID=A0AAV9TN36_9PEZI
MEALGVSERWRWKREVKFACAGGMRSSIAASQRLVSGSRRSLP